MDWIETCEMSLARCARWRNCFQTVPCSLRLALGLAVRKAPSVQVTDIRIL